MATGAGSPSKPFAEQALRGTFCGAISWIAVSKVFAQVLAFGRSIVLARLLLPADYGLWGMATLVLNGVFAMTHFNLGSSVVAHQFHDEQERRHYLNTVWTADLSRRAGVSIILAALAYPMAMYFDERRLVGVLLVISSSPLVLGFENIGMWQLHKEMRFRQIVIQQQVSDVLTTVLTIVVAYVTRDFRALVISQWVQALCLVGLSYLVCDFRPRLQIDRKALRKSVNFGKHMLVLGLLGYLTTQFDNVVVGRYLGASVLGAYILAYRLATLPVEFVNSVFAMVLFPLYAKVNQEHPEKLERAFCRTATASAALLIGILLPMQLAAGSIIRMLYGKKWEAAIPFLGVLSLLGIFRGLAETIGPFLRAIGRPDLDARAKMAEVSLFVPLVFWLVPAYGGLGAASAGLASFAVAYAVRLAMVLRFVRTRRWQTALLLTKPLTVGFAVYGGACALERMGSGALVAAVCCGAGYAMAMLAVDAGLRAELIMAVGRLRLRQAVRPAGI